MERQYNTSAGGLAGEGNHQHSRPNVAQPKRPHFPSPVFERIYDSYLAVREKFQGELATEATSWRAIVHTDHGYGMTSRIQYSGTIHEDNGQIYMPYDFENIHEDDNTDFEEEKRSDAGRSMTIIVDGGVVVKEVVHWENNKLWYDIIYGNTDMALTA